ncbi:MAG TPA: helix-turn-helix domain-containing protein [Chitinophagaceae bacterium]
MPNFDTSNKLFQLAADMVNHSSQNIFLTGKAGTGKTTFLKYIKENCGKQTAVIAPTGVAAINAGGTTIHSFFQLPFSPFVPGHSANSDEVNTRHSLLGRIKMNNEKRKVLQLLELLIIDEISMVRCDMLDAIDAVLRHFRNRNNEPFGGVQLLMIGDMHQLPPVINDSEWKILSQFYNSPYFFSSIIIQQNPPAFISFEKIYRQSDEQFIQLLNQVRNNELDEVSMRFLHKRYQPEFSATKEDGYIILTTHNYKADTINNAELNKIHTPLYYFKAVIDGDFFEKAFPADELLQLREGAQVMFIKNDSEKIRRYYNGKIGTVTKIDDENIYVQCKDETETIEVSKEKWENIRYLFDKTSQQLKEDVIGSFTQFPLRLAWAITIHKSQGLTFEKAIIDAGAAFAPGQVYVALSRCTNLEGLVLHSRINQNSIKNDERITEFSRNKNSLSQLENQLSQAKHDHQQNLLLQLFDFLVMIQLSEELLAFLKENSTSFNAESLSWTEKLLANFKTLQDVSQKFHSHLQIFFQQPTLPHENPALQNRVKAAAIYFYTELEKQLYFLQQSSSVTDSRNLAKQYNEAIFEIYSLLAEKKFIFEFCKNGFDAPAWHQKKKEFKLPPSTVNAYAGASTYKTTDSPHPALHQQLRRLRDDICSRKNQPIYMVAGSVTLNEMATFLPQSIDELAKISGFGKVKLDAYGSQFVNVIQQYCEQHKLSSLIHEKIPKRQRKEKDEVKTDTKSETFKLYKEGRSVNEIATIRNFAIQTIEGHLAWYVRNGDIKIDDLVSREKLILIEPLIKNNDGNSITPIKQQVGNDVSFGEIRLVMAWNEFQKEKEKNIGSA